MHVCHVWLELVGKNFCVCIDVFDCSYNQIAMLCDEYLCMYVHKSHSDPHVSPSHAMKNEATHRWLKGMRGCLWALVIISEGLEYLEILCVC